MRLVAELGPETLHPLTFDVCDRAAMVHTIEGLPAEFSDIDLLMNSAGPTVGLKPARAADLEDWEAMVDTNVKGLMHVTRTVLPAMVARDRGPRRQSGLDRDGAT